MRIGQYDIFTWEELVLPLLESYEWDEYEEYRIFAQKFPSFKPTLEELMRDLQNEHWQDVKEFEKYMIEEQKQLSK